ncbi:hypothetical protein COOONC_01186 [Cooperia oncophora]
MSLCIVDSEPLDVMESTLADLDFGAIENKGVERKEWESPYGEEQLRKRIEGALDRFAQFFLTPKFAASMMEREVWIIEFEGNVCETASIIDNAQSVGMMAAIIYLRMVTRVRLTSSASGDRSLVEMGRKQRWLEHRG